CFYKRFNISRRTVGTKNNSKKKRSPEKHKQGQNKKAYPFKNGQETNVDIENILRGDTMIVKPGEKVPIDGQVIDGYSMVDESLLTGESMPTEKTIGTAVYAGTINQNGILTAKVTKTVAETALSNIISIEEEAQASKAPI